MIKQIARIKMLFNKETLKVVGYFFVDCFGWLVSLFTYMFSQITKPGIFYGYSAYYWAGKYADKRTAKWHPEWDQNGRQQGVFPLTDTKLLVCSKMELKIYKKKGLINKKFKPRKAIKKSYYTTEL
jgi:hypothetical protein